jgi:hypothetical protein
VRGFGLAGMSGIALTGQRRQLRTKLGHGAPIRLKRDPEVCDTSNSGDSPRIGAQTNPARVDSSLCDPKFQMLICPVVLLLISELHVPGKSKITDQLLP